MCKKTRPDGTLLKVKGLFKLFPYVMPTKTESAIYFEQEIEIDPVLNYLEKVNSSIEDDQKKITFFHVFLCAGARTVVLRPRINRFISNYRYYQRNNISFNFVARREFKEANDDEINVIVKFSPYDTIQTVAQKVREEVGKARSPKGNATGEKMDLFELMPGFFFKAFVALYRWLDRQNLVPAALLEALPFYTTAFVTHVGSVGLDAPFHHNFEVGTTGLFVAIGKYKKVRFLDENGKLQEKNTISVRYTLDDKVVDGFYCAKALNLLKEFIESPEQLETAPEVSDEMLAKLKLKEYPAKKIKTS